MRVLGIDCGSRITGYGIIDANRTGCSLVDFGAIRVESSIPLALRLKTVYSGIAKVIGKFQPDAAAFESLFYATNAQSALKLGHVRGVLMFAAVEANLPVAEYSPLQVKSAVTGYGRAEKAQVQHMVRTLLKLKISPHPYDASDALAVAICHVHSGETQKAPSAHL